MKKLLLCFFIIFSSLLLSAKKSDFTIFDSDYVHDEKEIQKKVGEIKKSQEQLLLSGSFEKIDNIILENALLKSYENWKGTRYKWGGDSLGGIDCSALTRRVYREVFEFELPRVSVDQVKEGTRIEKSQLKPGDLLFFRPENRINHVAVYLGNSLFINASSSQGVVLSSLDNSYWGKYFKYAVRVSDARK